METFTDFYSDAEVPASEAECESDDDAPVGEAPDPRIVLMECWGVHPAEGY